jgi:hypothetical protein
MAFLTGLALSYDVVLFSSSLHFPCLRSYSSRPVNPTLHYEVCVDSIDLWNLSVRSKRVCSESLWIPNGILEHFTYYFVGPVHRQIIEM